MKKKISKILYGIALFLVGIFLLVTNKNTTFSCRRVEGEPPPCELTSSGILGSQTTQISLEDLQGAIVKKGRKHTYRVVLVTKKGQIRLTSWSDIRYGSKQKMANQIDSFLRNPQERVLLTKERAWWFIYFVSGLAIVSGIATILNLI